MKLVRINAHTLPFGKPIPFPLRGANGSLLADKGYIIRSHDDLGILLERGQALYVDTDESGESYRHFMAQLQAMMLASDKPLGEIAGMTMAVETPRPPVEEIEPTAPTHPDWVEWQQRLTKLLRYPQAGTFQSQLEQLFTPLSAYTQRHPDAALLALVQMSAEETRFYSATHALLTASVCLTVAREALRWPENRLFRLGMAALSMKISISRLQDELSQQTTPLTTQQAQSISNHAQQSVQLLRSLGVSDPLWLEAVGGHHLQTPGRLADRTLGRQMARLIQRADLFGARIAPRASRDPVSVTMAMQSCYYDETKVMDEAGAALVKTLGIYPPGAWVKLASGEIGIVIRRGASASTPRVAVLVNNMGLPTGEALPRDTAQPQWKIIGPIAHKTAQVRPAIDRLLTL